MLFRSQRILAERDIVSALQWYPAEVLHLTRWKEPDPTEAASSPQNQRIHTIRAFVCAMLLWSNGEYLRMNVEPVNSIVEDSENATLVQLLASLPVLGPPSQLAALRFVAWRAQDLSGCYDDAPFFMCALLTLVLRTQADLTVAELREIIDALYASEQQTREEMIIRPPNGEAWLLGLTYFDLRHHVWQQIGQEIGAFSVKYVGTDVALLLLDIARRFEGGPQNG